MLYFASTVKLHLENSRAEWKYLPTLILFHCCSFLLLQVFFFYHHVSWHGFLWICLFRVSSASWILDLCLFPSLRKFQILLEYIFSLTLSLLSFCYSDDMNFGIFVMVSQILRLCSFFFFNEFSPFYSYWVISWKFMDSSLLSSPSYC